MRFLILGRSVGLKKKPKKTNYKKSRNSRPWYPRTTLKVNIHIFVLTKCTIYCEKCSCFCPCFSLGCYYAHFSDLKELFHVLYYYMRNYCNLIGLEQWYFSLIWNTYMWKLQTFCGYVIVGINTTRDISKLSQISLTKRLVKLRITILKYYYKSCYYLFKNGVTTLLFFWKCQKIGSVGRR